jgi:hypothetical protein
MKTNYTPGRWIWSYSGKGTIRIEKESDKKRVATIILKPGWQVLDPANAKLIAASPDMVDMLQEVLACLQNETWSNGTRQYLTSMIQGTLNNAIGDA